MVRRVLYEKVSSYFINMGAFIPGLSKIFLGWPNNYLVYMLVFPVFLSFIFMFFYFIFYKNDINNRYIFDNLVLDIIFVIGEFWVLCNI